MTNPPSNGTRASWADTLRVYLEPATLRMLFLGFSAGLPLLLVLGTLSFRLREAGVDRTTIGYLSWVGLAYGFKWVWAPLVDRMPLPLLTRAFGMRRSWLLLAQGVVIAGLVGMALADPKEVLDTVVWCAVLVALGSATQDIALDAFRIESATTDRQATLAAAYQTGYRLAMIWAGAGVLWIAARAEMVNAALYQHTAWQTAYLVMAGSMLVGVLTVLFTSEPIEKNTTLLNAAESASLIQNFTNNGVPLYGAFIAISPLIWLGLSIAASIHYGFLLFINSFQLFAFFISNLAIASYFPYFLIYAIGYIAPVVMYLFVVWKLHKTHIRVPINRRLVPLVVWYTRAFLIPFAEFVNRYQWQAVLILGLIAVYRISDVVMGIMANPFYVDMGYTKDEVAAVTKVFGVIMTLVGAFIGGVLSMRLGVMRVLMLGAVLSAASNLLFAWLGTRGHDLTALIWVISADNLSSGIASAAFIAYLSSLTNVNYSATQYALFSSMMLLLPKWLAGFSGKYVDAFGYGHFFTATALLGVPVLLLVWLASRVPAASIPSNVSTAPAPSSAQA